MFEATTKVGTPLALVAFALAVGFLVAREYFRRRQREIETAAPSDRIAMVSKLEDGFDLPVATLSDKQRFQLAQTMLANRAARFTKLAVVSVIFALLASAVTVVAIVARQSADPLRLPTMKPAAVGVPSAAPLAPATAASALPIPINNSNQAPDDLAWLRIHLGAPHGIKLTVFSKPSGAIKEVFVQCECKAGVAPLPQRIGTYSDSPISVLVRPSLQKAADNALVECRQECGL